MTDSDKILHVPAAKKRYPNDPAVYVARIYGWYRVFAMMRALLTVNTDAEDAADGDNNNDLVANDDDDDDDDDIRIIFSILKSNPRAAIAFANPATL